MRAPLVWSMARLEAVGGGSEGFRLQQVLRCPGFRFRPTDEELLSYYYLRKKMNTEDKCVPVIVEVDFCKYEPWELPMISILQTKDPEWFFFSLRGKKDPNGSQTRRATRTGYWKATGKERPVKSGCKVLGTKRTLVFYRGRAPKGERTDWITHEFSLKGSKLDVPQDSFVLCRLWKKHYSGPNNGDGGTINQIQVFPGFGGTDDGKETKNKISSSVEELLGANETTSSQQKEFRHEVCPSSASESYILFSDILDTYFSFSKLSKDFFSEMYRKPHLKGGDFIAEILEDNIADIDDFPRYGTSSELPQAWNEVDVWSSAEDPTMPQQLGNMTSSPVLQGTAFRRIKLQNKRFGHRDIKMQETNKGFMEEMNPWDVSLEQEGVRNRFSLWEGNVRFEFTILFCLGLMILLVLLVLMFW